MSTLATIHVGDCLDVLQTLPDESVQCCVTSPPYWRLRDYGVAGQIGQEATPQEFVATMVQVFAEVRRVLRRDGVCCLNLGDSYAGAAGGNQGKHGARYGRRHTQQRASSSAVGGLKPKDLIGIPWRVAFALQADGWWLRQDIIWHKPNPMPESVQDRCTKAHEYVFLLTKSDRYYWNADAIAEDACKEAAGNRFHKYVDQYQQSESDEHRTKAGLMAVADKPWEKRNKRSVWTIATQPFTGAHFATMPPALAEPCILAGSKPGDIVLDPFTGAGTTGMVAANHGREFVGAELNPEYAKIAQRRIRKSNSMFVRVEIKDKDA